MPLKFIIMRNESCPVRKMKQKEKFCKIVFELVGATTGHLSKLLSIQLYYGVALNVWRKMINDGIQKIVDFSFETQWLGKFVLICIVCPVDALLSKWLVNSITTIQFVHFSDSFLITTWQLENKRGDRFQTVSLPKSFILSAE